MKFVMALVRDLAGREIDAAIGWLKSVRGMAKVGCVGFCMGGGLALAAAIRPTSKVDAVHVCYGGDMPSAEAIATIKVPVLGSYGAEDEGIPKAQVDMLRDTLARSGVPHEVTLYPGAGHAFFNDTRPSYREGPAMDTWMKSVAWFNRYLAS